MITSYSGSRIRPRARVPALYLILVSALLLSTPSSSQAQYERLQARLGTLLEELPHSQTVVSAMVMSLPDQKIVYERNADTALVPASNQKIVTAAVALHLLGVDYRFDTILTRQGDDLVLVGTGDPALGDRKLAEEQGGGPLDVFMDWADKLKDRGVETIKGDIIIDDRAFEQRWAHPSWEASDSSKWYAAPVGALNFNDNCIEISVSPTSKGKLARYEVFPETDWIRINNRCKTGTKNKPWIHRETEEGSGFRVQGLGNRSFGPSYSLRGACDRRTKLKPISVTDPGLFCGEVFKQVLASRGIEVGGQVKREAKQSANSSLPAAQIVATHSTPMVDVLKRALRDSQNLFAECLMKMSARHSGGASPARLVGGWEAGSQAMVRTVQSWGIDTTNMVAADGSGLSRDNRASSRQLVQILAHVYGQSGMGDAFIGSMSLNGTSGTLKKRMKDISGRVWAKTGYLKGIRSLTGYVMADSGRWYAFSVIFNHFPGGSWPYNQIHDDVCRALVACEFTPKN